MNIKIQKVNIQIESIKKPEECINTPEVWLYSQIETAYYVVKNSNIGIKS